MIGSLLIANRGEIARRIIRTARRLGVRTVAVYSEADAGAPHVREADEAVLIGPAPARESYLDRRRDPGRRASETGAEAIHPGYGFLSENADFAEAVIAAGLVWVGPPPAAIRAMGLKDAAKRLMAEAGVPVTPGYLGDDQSAADAGARGRRDRLAGADQGGGRRRRQGHAPGRRGGGLRRRAGQLPARGAASLRRRPGAAGEATSTRPRHIEVQVFADAHGQRRPPVRARLLAAAPPPEGDRGGARAGHGRRDPRGASAARRSARPRRSNYRRRGHHRVHRRRARRACAPTASGSWR